MSQTLTDNHYEVPVNLDQRLVIVLDAQPEPDYTVPVAVGIPLRSWGFGDSVTEAIENLVFIDPLFPTDEELAIAKSLYGAVKAAHPELTPNDPTWFEENAHGL